MTEVSIPEAREDCVSEEVVEYQFGDILNIGIVFVVAGLVLTYGGDLTQDINTELGQDSCAANTNGFTTFNATRGECLNTTTNTYETPTGAAFNVSSGSLGGQAALSERMPTLGKIAVAAIIIGVLVTAFVVRR